MHLDLPTFVIGSGVLIGVVVAAASLRPAWIVDHPRIPLLLVALLSIGAAAAVFKPEWPFFRIELDPSSEALLPSRDPGEAIYRQAVLDFGSDDIYVVAMETEDVFSEENLLALRRVTDGIHRLEGVTTAESLSDVHSYRYDAEEDWVEIRKFIIEVPSDPDELAALRRRALADPLYRNVIVSADGRAAAINVSFEPMSDGEFVERNLDGQIGQILQEESRDGRHFYRSGRPHIRAEAHYLMVWDLITLIPMAVVIANVVLFLLTGSLRATLIPLASCLTGTLWAYAALVLMGQQLNVITIVLGPILICVGTVYGIHVIARYEAISLTVETPREAALETLRYTSLPVVMAGLTTCVGFGALLLADVRATNQLGGYCVLGVAAITMLSLTGVPALLALLPLERSSFPTRPLWEQRTRIAILAGRLVDGFLAGIAVFVRRFSGSVLIAWAALTVLAVSLIPQTVIDTDFLSVFDPQHRVRTDFAAVNRLLAGAVPLYVVLNGEREGTFRDPESLRAVADIEAELAELPGVEHVLSAADLVRVAHRVLSGDNAAAADLPESRDALAEAIFTIPKEQLRRLANSNHSKANLVVRTSALGSSAMRKVEAGIRAVLERHELPAGVRSDVTGNAILINRSADGIAGNQATQVGFAAVTILLLVAVAFRSLPMAALAMVPNIVPVLLYFGALGAGAATLSLATALIGSIALGIAIDDTVHFLVTYHRERDTGRSAEDAVAYCIRSVGRPITVTSVIIICGFLSLLVSNFVTLREFGYLTALTMAICLLTDLLLLPALLLRTQR